MEKVTHSVESAVEGQSWFQWKVVGGAFGSDPGDPSYLTECQLPDGLSPARHPHDKRDGKQRCRCV